MEFSPKPPGLFWPDVLKGLGLKHERRMPFSLVSCDNCYGLQGKEEEIEIKKKF